MPTNAKMEFMNGDTPLGKPIMKDGSSSGPSIPINLKFEQGPQNDFAERKTIKQVARNNRILG